MKRVLSYEPIREQEVGLLIESFSQFASCGVVVDFTEKSITLIVGVIFRMAFGMWFRGDGLKLRPDGKLVYELFPIPFVGRPLIGSVDKS